MSTLHFESMKKLLFIFYIGFINMLFAQKPCETNPKYTEFDFWIGDWTVYNQQHTIAGYSKISKILENCVILEEWTSATTLKNGMYYSGKSYNTFDINSGEWQQCWVDNVGGSTEFLHGKYENKALVFTTDSFKKDTINSAKRRLTFFNLEKDKVRQLGEISLDNGKTWKTEYDLEYRKNTSYTETIVTQMFEKLTQSYNSDNIDNLTNNYSEKGIIKGYTTEIIGKENIHKYWVDLKEKLGGNWKLNAEKITEHDKLIWVQGTSVITDLKNNIHKVNFTLILIQENNTWKIFQDTYW